MPREVEEYCSDVHPAARNPPGPQQLHYYNERRHPRGALFAGRFDRGDMGSPYYPYESWPASGRPYYPRPEIEFGPGSAMVREAYYSGDGPDVYHQHRNAYRRPDTDERYFRSPDGTRDGSTEREHGERKRRHHKSSRHRHRRSRHHRRHKRSKHSEAESDNERGNDLPSLTLGAEISRGRKHGITRTSAPESDISDDSSEPLGETADSTGASVTPASTVPVAYLGYNIESDKTGVPDASARLEDGQQSTTEHSDGSSSSSSDAESVSKSQSSTSSSDSETETGSPAAAKRKARNQQVTKVRSSYATAQAAKLRQNRQALEERSCRRPDTSTPRLQPADGCPTSVIDRSSVVNTETSRSCSDGKLCTDNGLNVERLMAANKRLEMLHTGSAVSCSAAVPVTRSTQPSSSQSVMHREITSTASLNWYVVYTCFQFPTVKVGDQFGEVFLWL